MLGQSEGIKCRKNYNEPKPSTKPTKTDETESPSSDTKSNLERFLDATRPSVPAQFFSEDLKTGDHDSDFQPYFLLKDLWEAFNEWSTYGAGVPVVIEDQTVVQYYTPFLSGIQIYGESPALSSDSKSRPASEDSYFDSYVETSSDGSIEYELEKICNCSKEEWAHRHLSSENTSKMRKTSSSSDEHSKGSSDEGDAGNTRRVLLFQFFEQEPPHLRVPLTYKIEDLEDLYPDVKNLRSCDIHAASWISIAWYPIYRIPNGPTLKNLDACFLTYHSLSTPMRGSGHGQPPVTCSKDAKGIPKIYLPAFGMATYKLRSLTWVQNVTKDRQRVNSLLQAADKWLTRLRVTHPDYHFFITRSRFWRDDNR